MLTVFLVTALDGTSIRTEAYCFQYCEFLTKEVVDSEVVSGVACLASKKFIANDRSTATLPQQSNQQIFTQGGECAGETVRSIEGYCQRGMML
jgi:hypothetical protein